VSERRLWTEPVVGVIGPHLEPTRGDDQSLTGKLITEPLATLPSRASGSKLIRQLCRVRRPSLNDELLEGFGERDLTVGQLWPAIAHGTARRHSSPVRLVVASTAPFFMTAILAPGEPLNLDARTATSKPNLGGSDT